MPTVTVSDKGQVVIPADLRRQLGITPGCQLDFALDGNAIRITLQRRRPPTRPEDGDGMLVCTQPGQRRLADFDVARTMRDSAFTPP